MCPLHLLHVLGEPPPVNPVTGGLLTSPVFLYGARLAPEREREVVELRSCPVSRDIGSDLGFVRRAVGRVPRSGAVFYLGATTRSAQNRWDGVGSERLAPGESRLHSVRFAGGRMHVLLTGPADAIAEREERALQDFGRDPRCVNRSFHSTGFGHCPRCHALLYMCVGPLSAREL